MNQNPTPMIRPAGKPDQDSLAGLCTKLGYTSTPEQIGLGLETLQTRVNESVVFVAELNGKVVGWVHAQVYRLRVDDPEVEIGGLVVDAKSRGEGVGEKLMQAAETWACNRGCRSVYLRSNTIRKEAHRFYKHIGYRIVKSQYALRKTLK